MPILLDDIEGFIRNQLESLWSLGLNPEDVRIEAFASKLAVHKRTLQRKLSDKGLIYADILDDARKEKSLDLIVSTDSCVKDISTMLGFTDRTGYHHAHKRWFGMSPQQLRVVMTSKPVGYLASDAANVRNIPL